MLTRARLDFSASVGSHWEALQNLGLLPYPGKAGLQGCWPLLCPVAWPPGGPGWPASAATPAHRPARDMRALPLLLARVAGWPPAFARVPAELSWPAAAPSGEGVARRHVATGGLRRGSGPLPSVAPARRGHRRATSGGQRASSIRGTAWLLAGLEAAVCTASAGAGLLVASELEGRGARGLREIKDIVFRAHGVLESPAGAARRARRDRLSDRLECATSVWSSRGGVLACSSHDASSQRMAACGARRADARRSPSNCPSAGVGARAAASTRGSPRRPTWRSRARPGERSSPRRSAGRSAPRAPTTSRPA